MVLSALLVVPPAVFAQVSSSSSGTLPVASTYFQLRASDDAKRQGMLCGSNANGVVHYIDELLADPQAARHADVTDPTEVAGLGKTIPFYYFVLYPTTPGNHRADMPMFGQYVLPRMDGPTDSPMIATGARPYPIIAFSHGFNVHPFYDLPNLVALASHGYVVVCIFEGDGRFIRNPLQAEVAKIRARSVIACVDDLLTDKAFSAHVDGKKMGVFGISRGGNAAGRLLGATSSDEDSSCYDSRFVVAVGESPALAEFNPEEDMDFSRVTAPFLAIDGEQDQLQPIITRVLSQSKGPAMLIGLPGQGHVPNDETKRDVITPWLCDFFDAFLYGDQLALGRIDTCKSRTGESHDRVMWHYNLPGAAAARK